MNTQHHLSPEPQTTSRNRELIDDIGWNEAFMAWIQEGLADRFSRLYHPGVRLANLYRAVVQGHPTEKDGMPTTPREKHP